MVEVLQLHCLCSKHVVLPYMCTQCLSVVYAIMLICTVVCVGVQVCVDGYTSIPSIICGVQLYTVLLAVCALLLVQWVRVCALVWCCCWGSTSSWALSSRVFANTVTDSLALEP